jgi:hypothetical protein
MNTWIILIFNLFFMNDRIVKHFTNIFIAFLLINQIKFIKIKLFKLTSKLPYITFLCFVLKSLL